MNYEAKLAKRLAYSLQLLQSTNQSISDIGSLVGYKYPNHFSASFKKMYSVSPTELRNDCSFNTLTSATHFGNNVSYQCIAISLDDYICEIIDQETLFGVIAVTLDLMD
ncbi:MAG: helix-turn-helix domain-containing protein [Cytophagales bacterium]|nr:helix-turn-helix domain-containing protein [Cytophagales bacterium]